MHDTTDSVFDLERLVGYDAGRNGDDTGPPIRERPIPCGDEWWRHRRKELDRHWLMGWESGADVRAVVEEAQRIDA